MKTYRKAAVQLLRLLVLLISIEYALPALVTIVHQYSTEQGIQDSDDDMPLGFFIPGKEDQKEQSEKEGKDNLASVELADFSKLAVSLSDAHSHLADFSAIDRQEDTQSSLFKLHCVLII